MTIEENKDGVKVTEDDGYVLFEAGESSAEKSVHIGSINISPHSPKVYFYFTIHSLLSAEGKYIQIIVNEERTTPR